MGDGVMFSVFLLEDDWGSPPDDVHELIDGIVTEAIRSISIAPKNGRMISFRRFPVHCSLITGHLLGLPDDAPAHILPELL